MAKTRYYLLLNQFLKVFLSLSPIHKKLYLLEYPKSGGTWVGGLISTSTSYLFTEGLPPIHRLRQVIHTHRPALLSFGLNSTHMNILLVRNPFDTYISLYYHSLFFNGKGNNVLVDSCRKTLNSEFIPSNFSASFLSFLNYLLEGRFTYLVAWHSFHEPLSLSRNFYLLRYEDIWDDAPGNLVSMFHALGIPYNYSDLLSSCTQSRSKILAARESFQAIALSKGNETVPFNRRGGYGHWKNILNTQHINLISQASQPLMHSFGYR